MNVVERLEPRRPALRVDLTPARRHVALVEGVRHLRKLANVVALGKHEIGEMVAPEELPRTFHGVLRRNDAVVREQHVVLEVRVLRQVREHEGDRSQLAVVERDGFPERIRISEVLTREPAAYRGGGGIGEGRLRVAVDDLVGEHLEDVRVGDVHIAPNERVLGVADHAIGRARPRSGRREAHVGLHVGEFRGEHRREQPRGERDALRPAVGLELRRDTIDALVLHVVPVVRELAAQVEAEHDARRDGERQPRDVDQRIQLVAQQEAQHGRKVLHAGRPAAIDAFHSAASSRLPPAPGSRRTAALAVADRRGLAGFTAAVARCPTPTAAARTSSGRPRG